MGLKAFDYFAVIRPTSIVPYIGLFVNINFRRVRPFPLEGAEGVFYIPPFLTLQTVGFTLACTLDTQRRWRAGHYPDKAATKGG